MTADLIFNIAALCYLGGIGASNMYPSNVVEAIEKSQTSCQTYYAKCLKGKKPKGEASYTLALLDCIGERGGK